MKKDKYVGPRTGRVYDLKNGDKIDPVTEGIVLTGHEGAPSAYINGRELYRRIFVRLKTPYETLTCSPIRNGADFARRVSIIENWFNSVIRKGNYVLTFTAEQVTDNEAADIENHEKALDSDRRV